MNRGQPFQKGDLDSRLSDKPKPARRFTAKRVIYTTLAVGTIGLALGFPRVLERVEGAPAAVSVPDTAQSYLSLHFEELEGYARGEGGFTPEEEALMYQRLGMPKDEVARRLELPDGDFDLLGRIMDAKDTYRRESSGQP